MAKTMITIAASIGSQNVKLNWKNTKRRTAMSSTFPLKIVVGELEVVQQDTVYNENLNQDYDQLSLVV